MKRLAAGFLAVVLAGCGPAMEKPVHIAVPTGIVETYLVHLAGNLGHFREEGLDVAIDELQGGSLLVESVLAGSSDAVYITFSHSLQLAAQGRVLRSYFLGSETLSMMLVVCQKRAGQIRHVEDLRGTTVGVAGFGGVQQELLQYILTRQGLALADVKLVAYGGGPSAIASLQYGKVDAGMIDGSAFAILRRRAPGVRILVDPRTRQGTKALTGLDHYPGFALSSTTAWLNRNPSIARKLTKAMAHTLRWVRAHSAEEVRERLPASLRTDDKEADLETLRVIIDGTSQDGRMPLEGPESVRRFLAVADGRVRNAKIDPSATFFTNQFVDEASK